MLHTSAKFKLRAQFTGAFYSIPEVWQHLVGPSKKEIMQILRIPVNVDINVKISEL